MSRRDDLTDDGKLPCGLCKMWLPITSFYTQPVHEDTPSKYIWWGDPVTGKQYGRPKSYCRVCNRRTVNGKDKFNDYVEKLKTSDKTRIHDIDKAETKAYFERARRIFEAEHPL